MDTRRLLLLFLWLYPPPTISIVTLRPRNERVAWGSGVDCLQSVQTLFQRLRIVLEDSEEDNRTMVLNTRNVIMLHLHNLTSPAAEIESNYLALMHTLISSGKMLSQLRVVSDHYPIDGLLNVPFNVLSTAEFYILVTDDMDKLFEAMSRTLARASSWNPAAKFIILFNHIEHRSRLGRWSVVASFQEMALRFHINHLCLLWATSARTYHIYLSRLFGRSPEDSKCVPMSAERVTSCENGQIANQDKFAAAVQRAAVPKHMRQCTFTACASVSQPFVRRNCKGGLEILLLRFIAEYMDFDLNVRCTKLPRGDIDEHGQLSDLLLEMREDKCDFIVGAMYPDNDIHLHFRASLPYYEDSYAWFVPLAPKRAAWKGLAYIFKISTWLLIGAVLLLSSYVWHWVSVSSRDLQRFRRLPLCLLNNWSTLLGISVPLQPLRNPLRVLFVAAALYSLNLTTVYTSNLIAVFTQPAYDAQLNSIEAVLESGLWLGGRQEYQDWFETGYPLDEQIAARYNISDDFQPSNENLQRVRLGMQAILVSRLFVVSRNYSNLIYGLPSNVFTNQMEIIFEKGFPLVSLFDKVINRLKDNGILYKFFGDWQYEMAKNNAIGADDSEIILTVQHLEGAFAILGYGLLVSTVVFVMELLFKHKLQVLLWRIRLLNGYYLTVKYVWTK